MLPIWSLPALQVCEVQSDKATVEITSRYDGVVSKLHYAVRRLHPLRYPLRCAADDACSSLSEYYSSHSRRSDRLQA